MRSAGEKGVGLCCVPGKEVQISRDTLSLGILILVAAVTMTACHNDKGVRSEVASIAKAAVADREGWAAGELEADPVLKKDGEWEVTIWRLPKTPGDHRIIVISSDKKVVKYSIGR
jgi:hypothetical protein